MFCAIWYHLYNLKDVKNAKINTPPWVFFTFLKLYKWYQIAQRITFVICDCFSLSSRYLIYLRKDTKLHPQHHQLIKQMYD